MTDRWPALDYLSWQDTCSALHLYLQIVGKYRFAHTPWVNHSWHATFYVTPRGLTTSPIPDGSGIELSFDFHTHEVVGVSGDGRTASIALKPTTVAAFHSEVRELVSNLGGTPTFSGRPNEVPNPVPFAEDDRERPYDRDAVERFHQALVAIDRVFKSFRGSFLGKSSPVHLFWGSFDLAITRFSGRRAPLHGGGIPALPDDVAQEAYDREVASAGFWPGGGGIDEPAFYAYAYPAPEGYSSATIRPAEAAWSDTLSEFILPYGAVAAAPDPDAALMAFLTSAYDAAAHLGGWDRDLLDCAWGAPREVRRPDAVLAPDAPPEGEVELEEGPTKGRYRIELDGAEAEMTYSRAGDDLIIIDHTYVPEELRGRRIGSRLVFRAVEDARRRGFAILPLCPFAKATFERHPAWQDVLQS